MKDEHFENEIRRRWGNNSEKSRWWVGSFFLLIGGLFLLRASGVEIFWWVFTWPMFLIALGLFIGLRHGFKGPAWFILILIGGVFLYDKIEPDVSLKPYLLPIIFISIGLIVLFRPKKNCRRMRDDVQALPSSIHETNASAQTATETAWQGSMDDNDVLDITAVFGGIKKKILSKNFRGGDVVAIMGGCEIDLTQADFKQKVMLDIFCMFGGMKLIIPPGWNVQSEAVAIFGGVDDKRPPATNYDPNKVIFLEGTCIFGGIEIKSF